MDFFKTCGVLSYDQVLYREASTWVCALHLALLDWGMLQWWFKHIMACHRRALESSRWVLFFCPQLFKREYNYGRIYSIPINHYVINLALPNGIRRIRWGAKVWCSLEPQGHNQKQGQMHIITDTWEKTHGLSLYRAVIYDQSPFHITESIRLEQIFEITDSNLWPNTTLLATPWVSCHWVPWPVSWDVTHGNHLSYHWVLCHFDITTFLPLHYFSNVLGRGSYCDQRNEREYGIQSACSVKQLWGCMG